MEWDRCLEYVQAYTGKEPMSCRALARQFNVRTGRGTEPGQGGVFVKERLIAHFGKDKFDSMNF